jgi:hypothetical protein
MKALMLIIVLGSGMQQYPDGGIAIWFSDMNSCENAKEKVVKNLPQHYAKQWSQAVCVEVNQ